MKKAFVLAIVLAGLLHAVVGAQTTGGLRFFKNYFITGDYVVAGVGLRGLGGLNGAAPGIARGNITISGVPDGADVLGAFLYWQVVSKDTVALGPDSGAVGATFNGLPLSSADGPFSKVLDRLGTAPCWSSGGGTGSSGGTHRTYTYRADVRRFFDTDADDRIIANGTYQVEVPDSGPSGNGVPIALGASLIVIYRDTTKPFKAIVLYEGGQTIDNANRTLDLTLKGFYQQKTLAADITYVVGSGQLNKHENVYFNGSLLRSDIFDGSPDGASWDTDTYPVTLASLDASGPYGATVTTRIDTAGLSGADCLTPAMVGFKTAVLDSDQDGLLNLWETTGGLLDPNEHALPDLPAMGASPDVPDLFVEIGYMKTETPTLYGDVLKPAHMHMPVAAALKMAGDAYTRAGISPHFDVGNPAAYHALGPEYAAMVGNGDPATSDGYLVSAANARGGEAVDESVTACAWPDCQFPLYPGTVGWKAGFKFYRDQLLSTSPPALIENPPGSGFFDDPCDVESAAPGNDDGLGGLCERRFDRNRKHMFRYVWGAHFAGLPQSEYPCLDANDKPVPASAGGLCSGAGQPGFELPVKDNPAFHIPRTISGVADFPGADAMLVLGGFPDVAGRPIGTPYQQGATLMHELGHTFDLGHAGVYNYGGLGVPQQPNCNPNYRSVMNYLFQLRGLFNWLKPGVPQTDYSGEIFSAINEFSPSDLPWSTEPAPPAQRYFTGWYAPQSAFTIGSPVAKHCTGTQLLRDADGNLTEPPMVRVDGPGARYGTIDWDLDPATMTAPQDINFDGKPQFGPGALNAGSSDWANLRLNQLGGRRNVFGMSVDLGRDAMGRGDILGRDAMGRDAMGRDGTGRDAMGSDGMGRDAMGRDAMGRDAMGRDAMGGDGLGRDGMGHDWMDRDVDELDAETAVASGNAPPSEVAAGVALDCTGLSPELCHRIWVAWKATPVNPDTVVNYLVFRFRTDDGAPTATYVATVPREVIGTIDYRKLDPQELPNGSFTYFVIAEFQGIPPAANFFSGPSNFSPVDAVNTPPVANGDSYSMDQGTTLTVPAKGVLANDTDIDSPSLTADLVSGSGPSHGILTLKSDGSFTYTPNPSFFGTDGFRYTANDVDPANAREAAVTITVRDVTPPVVTLSIPAPTGLGGYFKTSPVTVGVTATDASNVSTLGCTDNGSLITVNGLVGIGTTVASGSLSVSGEGTNNLTCTATDGAGNTGTAGGTVKIDTAAPSITITAPANGATYFVNAAIASNYSCSDTGSGVASCVGTVPNGSNFDTTVGTKTFTVTATDVAGNTATKTNSYSVGYNVTLTPLKTPAQLGSAVPVVFQVKDGSGNPLPLSVVKQIESVFTGTATPCGASSSGTVETLFKYPDYSTGKSTLRYISTTQSDQFNWDTTSASTSPTITGKGCYTVLVYLDDQPTPRVMGPVQLK